MKLFFILMLCSLIRAEDLPIRIRVELDTIELSKTDAATQPSYAEVQKLLQKGQATRKDYQVLTARPGDRVVAESFEELIYPSDYEPPGFTPPPPTFELPSIYFHRPECPTVWETRSIGSFFEVEPSYGGLDLISLRLSSEKTRLLGDLTYVTHRDLWGTADLTRPVVHVQKFHTAIQVYSGRMTLLNIYSPLLKSGAPAGEKSLLVFVRARVIR